MLEDALYDNAVASLSELKQLVGQKLQCDTSATNYLFETIYRTMTLLHAIEGLKGLAKQAQEAENV